MSVAIGPRWMLCLLAASTLLSVVGSQFYMSCAYFLSPLQLKATRLHNYIKIPVVNSRYRPNQHCEWNIKTDNPDEVIKLYVDKCNVEGAGFDDSCQRDYVDVYDVKDGQTYHMDRFCDRTAEGTSYESSSSEMMIQFISNMKFEFSGISLTYSSVPRTSKPEESDSAIGVVIGMSLGVVLLVVIVVTICVWRKKVSSRRTPTRTSLPGYTPPQPGPSLPHPPEESVSVRRSSSLQVALPELPTANQTYRGQGRSLTPPPSYESLVQHEGLTRPQDLPMPQFPPDYETVVKEDLEADSRV